MELKAKLLDQLEKSKVLVVEGAEKMMVEQKAQLENQLKIIEQAIQDLSAMEEDTIVEEVLSQEGHVHYLALFASQLHLRKQAEETIAAHQKAAEEAKETGQQVDDQADKA